MDRNVSSTALVRSRLDIVQWIEKSVPLKKQGRSYGGLCPFHQEKTPSFTVDPDKQLFYCFGCHAGGDLFSFVMKKEGLSFREALVHCAQAAGVDLPSSASSEKSEHRKAQREEKLLLRVNALAQIFFEHTLKSLPSGHPLFAYLKKRGLSPSLLSLGGVGYAPPAWQGLSDFLSSRRAPLALAEKLGLVRQKSGRYYDFFRNRLIFPIRDQSGAVRGFGGRILENDTALQGSSSADGPKYLNSPESPIYHKREALYGLSTLKARLDRDTPLFVVEGYIDCLRLSDAGFPALAPLGTALTAEQGKYLKRLSDRITLVFDADTAGLRALVKAIGTLIELDTIPFCIRLPQGHDPDSFVLKEGPAAFAHLAENAPSALDFLLDWVRENPQNADTRALVVSLFCRLKDPVLSIQCLEKIASFFGTSPEALRKWAETSHSHTPPSISADKNPGAPSDEPHPTERRFMQALFSTPAPLSAEETALYGHLSPHAASELAWSSWGKESFRLVIEFYKREGRLPAAFEILPTIDSLPWREWLESTLTAKADDLPQNRADLLKTLEKIALLDLKNKLRGLSFSIEQAERRLDIDHMASLIEEKMHLLREVDAVRRILVSGDAGEGFLLVPVSKNGVNPQ